MPRLLHHISVRYLLNEHPIQKCGEKPRSVKQAPVLSIRDLQFCWKNRCALGEFRFSPHFSYAPDSQ